MTAALGLARRALGNAWPNPAVGCVIVQPDSADGRVVGRGWTQPGGRPHAETEAISRAGAGAERATAYVTLEPCDHHGKTPPCTEALIGAGIARAVIATEDPDPRVGGRGIAALREAGIEIEVGRQEAAAAELNAGFFMRMRAGRPLVTLKLATSLDGRIATRDGDSKWITGETARAWAHGLRASHDAIAVGSATARADDPELTCRLPGLRARSPVRVVFDGGLSLSAKSRMVATLDTAPLIVIAVDKADARKRAALEATGATVLSVQTDAGGRPDPAAALQALGAQGITRLLVEGGGVLAGALIAADLVDRVAWFRSPAMVGGDGVAAAGPLGVTTIAEAPTFVRTAIARAGRDLLETYRRQA